MLVASGDLLGECPVWDDRAGLLHRVAGAVLALDVATGIERRIDRGRHVGSPVLRADGEGLLVAAQGGFRAVDQRSGRDDPPVTAVPVLAGIGISNGLAWNAARSTLFHVDTLLRRVDRLSYDVAAGTVAERRPAFDLSGYPGLPDGMAIDAEDCLWVAFWRGGAVRRFTPDGLVLDEVPGPVSRSTSCCLGGPDLRELYITTARRSVRDVQQLAGAVFRFRVDVPGAPARRWRAQASAVTGSGLPAAV